LVKAMEKQPVKFLAIMPNISADEVMAYQRTTGLVMPVYADNLGMMQKRYGIQISLQNIWQFRVVSPEGKVVAYDASKESLEKVLSGVKPEWKYRSDGYDAKFDPVIDLLEWGQYTQAMKLLGPARKNKALAESANKLFDAVKKEGEQWKTDADAAVESDPVKSYDLYAKVATVFAGDDLAKAAAEPLKKLSKDKAVVAELNARRAFATFMNSMSKATAAQKPQALKACQDLAKKHAGTPTAEKAEALAKDLGG
jgi:hypothetical protein